MKEFCDMKSFFCVLNRRTILILFVLFGLNGNVCCQEATGFGQWKKYNFLDEFDEPMPGKYYVATNAKNSEGIYAVFSYSNTTDARNDIFTFHLNDGYASLSFDRDVSLKFKDATNKITTIKVPDSNLRAGQAFITNRQDVLKIGQILNKGNFRLSVSYHWAGDTYVSPNRTCAFYFTTQSKGFFNVVRKYFRSKLFQ